MKGTAGERDASLAGVRAFLKTRKPDMQQFQLGNEPELNRYLRGFARNEDEAPAA